MLVSCFALLRSETAAQQSAAMLRMDAALTAVILYVSAMYYNLGNSAIAR
jgi:hypothetical protein